jgi:hypothetical protein
MAEGWRKDGGLDAMKTSANADADILDQLSLTVALAGQGYLSLD